MRRVQRRKRPIDYVLPFLVLISVGVIGVMGFQVWQSWDKQGKADVYFYLAEGKAKILPYAQTDWDNGFSGTKLLLGDSLKTSPTGRVVVEFFNATKVRLDYDTAITLTDVSKGSDRETIVLNLDNGSVWVNGEKSAGVSEAYYEVRTTNLLVRATGTVFEVESDDAQIVRVFEGDVEVDILVSEDGQERTVETIDVGVGQEITLDDATLRAFEDNKSPSVLSAVSDEFKSAAWYRWNNKEDRFPTDFDFASDGGGTAELIDTEESLETMEEDEDGSTQETSEEDEEDEEDDESEDEEDDTANNIVDGDLSAPVITSPTETSIDTSSFTLAGTVTAGTAKVIVNSALGDYELGKFKKGDTEWSYNISEEFGNLKKGDNTYKVYAEDEEGNRSSAGKITITYKKESAPVTGDLTAPVVTSYNGGDSSEVDTDTVTIQGTIKGAEKVVVSGYTLSQFSAGDTTWKYVASESVGNLSPGKNEFEVYGVDPDGNKSEVVKFTVTYNKPEGSSEETSQEESSTEEPAEETADEEETPSGSIEYGF